jgi:hypothetical protein
LRDPRQEGKDKANLQAEDDIKNDTQLRRHVGIVNGKS